MFVEDMNDWMSCYGDDTVPTPNLDKLAARGVRFDRAYMPAGVCSATRSAVALGTIQTTYGVHNHRSSRQRVPEEVIHLPGGVKTVYEVFREQGYFVYNGGGKNDFNFIWEVSQLYDFDGKRTGFHGSYWQKRKEGQPFFAQIQLRGGKNSGKVDQPTDDKGQYPESTDSLRGVLERWSKQAVNPEYERARAARPPKTGAAPAKAGRAAKKEKAKRRAKKPQ
ncbi:sulfatase-like hydrolase/transferase [Planctomycetota bacterium]